jgi:hypothetical protein
MKKNRFQQLSFGVTALLLLLSAPGANAELANGRYGSAQVFDVQRNPAYPDANQPFEVSSFQAPYSADTGTQYTLGAGQYVQFFKVSDTPCRYGINLYNADGTLDRLISASGTIWGLGSEGFLHDSDPGGYGTFVSNSAGYNYGDSLTFTTPIGEATCLETAAYQASTTPTASPGPLPPAQIASVPTLSEWAMIFTASLMALSTFLVMRRRG